MDFQTVLIERCGATGIVCLNRPEKLNALNGQMIREVRVALEMLGGEEDVAVIIVKGAGRAFCSGKDLEDEYPDEATARRELEAAQAVTTTMLAVAKPIIAAIHGYALGGGCEWAMNCDLRIAAVGTKLGFPEITLGLTVTNAASKLLATLVGAGRAKQLIFTGEFIDAAKAEQWGLVNQVVPPELLEDSALRLAEKIAENSSFALALAKRALDSRAEQSVSAVLRAEIEDAMCVVQNDDLSARFADRDGAKFELGDS